MKRDSKPLAGNVLDAVLTESKRQAQTLRDMRVALENGDDETALEKAREVCGLPGSEPKSSKNPSPESSQQEGKSDSDKINGNYIHNSLSL
jgi:hypothetical protein